MKAHFCMCSMMMICPPVDDNAIPTALNAMICKTGMAGAYWMPYVYVMSQ